MATPKRKAILRYWSKQAETTALLGGALAAWFGVTERFAMIVLALLWWAACQAVAYALLLKSLD